MTKTVLLPAMLPGMREGVVCAFLKRPGDAVASGEALFDVETDKVVCSVEAEEAGTVRELLREEGDRLTVGSPVMTLDIAEPCGEGNSRAAAEPPAESFAGGDSPRSPSNEENDPRAPGGDLSPEAPR